MVETTRLFTPVPDQRSRGAVGVTVAVLALCAGFACRSASDRVQRRESALAENQAFSREMLAAIEQRNLDGLMAGIWHSPDVIFVGPRGEVVRGWDQVRPIEEEFLASFQSARIEIEDESYAILGDTAVAVVTLIGTLTGTDGEVQRARVRMSDVRRKESGKWVSIHNHSHPLETTAEPARDYRRN